VSGTSVRQSRSSFVEHYHCERNYQGLDNRLIAGAPVTDRAGAVRWRRRLGGLLTFYERAA
jgi:putative transposase